MHTLLSNLLTVLNFSMEEPIILKLNNEYILKFLLALGFELYSTENLMAPFLIVLIFPPLLERKTFFL